MQVTKGNNSARQSDLVLFRRKETQALDLGLILFRLKTLVQQSIIKQASLNVVLSVLEDFTALLGNGRTGDLRSRNPPKKASYYRAALPSLSIRVSDRISTEYYRNFPGTAECSMCALLWYLSSSPPPKKKKKRCYLYFTDGTKHLVHKLEKGTLTSK